MAANEKRTERKPSSFHVHRHDLERGRNEDLT